MIRCFGIRHHGPGSARSLERALRAMRPDCVLIEGPPDADLALPFAGHAEMVPPVALLVHAAADPSQAVFYPFARFSPEWVALRWALAERVPVRFIDLPIAHQLGVREPRDPSPPSRQGGEGGQRAQSSGGYAIDPIRALASAAGFDDADLFWERLVETTHGRDPACDAFAVFAAVADAMRAVRETAPPPSAREAQREAWMRQQLRAADKALFQNIAVVVGAWHVPALDLSKHTAKADGALLKGLPKTKTEVAWIPWTAARLAAESGYGAGVDAPGWYAHLYDFADDSDAAPRYRSVATAWAVRATRFLRERSGSAALGPADAVEVVRAADALATLRELAAPGLDELREALLSVSCAGVEGRLAPLRAALEIGDDLGAVPAAAPATPLRRDVEATLRHLRLKPTAEPTPHEWDLRKPLDRARTVFLHRLALLGVPYGRRTAFSGTVGAGTFKELWTLAWDPAFEVELALAARWGHTTADAAAARMIDGARGHTLTGLAEDLMRALEAELDPALQAITAALEDHAAVASDALELGRALPPLARVIRYSDVKETERARVEPLFAALFRRYAIGLPAAAATVDDEGAATHCEVLDALAQALSLVAQADLSRDHDALLATLAGLTPGPHAAAHARIQGRATRLLVERQAFDHTPAEGGHGPAALERLASLALGPAVAPATAAAWIEGLVAGAGVLLEPQRALWVALDQWLATLDEATFVAVLPILRRAFSHFTPGERRRMGALLVRRRGPAPLPGLALALDPARVALLRPVLTALYRPGLV